MPSAYLGSGYLTFGELCEWKTRVSRYTSVIASILEKKTGHKFSPIDTGSIVERFGLPRASTRKGMEYLKTDHDVMFVPTTVVASAQGGCLNIVALDGFEEYYNILSVDYGCKFLQLISDNERFIDNNKAKILMDKVITNITINDIYPKRDHKEVLLGLATINLTQRILKWDQI